MENTTDQPPTTAKLFTRAEVAESNNTTKTLIIIHNNVYDVYKFLNEHPGGEEVLLEQAGQDGTESFEDVGHSSDARQMMEPYKVGEIVLEERSSNAADKKKEWSSGNDDSSGSWKSWLIPVVLGILATVVYRYFIGAR